MSWQRLSPQEKLLLVTAILNLIAALAKVIETVMS
jgi:hypothetical protein